MSEGVVIAMAPCFGCGRLFDFNPHKVPSITPPGKTHREPVCENCVRIVNPRRRANGLPEIEILPGAYDPMPESEL